MAAEGVGGSEAREKGSDYGTRGGGGGGGASRNRLEGAVKETTQLHKFEYLCDFLYAKVHSVLHG